MATSQAGEAEHGRVGRGGRFQSDVFSLIGTNLITMVVGIATSSLLARCLGTRGRGEYAAIINWPNFLASVAQFGLPSAMVYFAAKEKADTRIYVSTALILSLPAVLLLGTVGWLAMPRLLSAQSIVTVQASRRCLVPYLAGGVIWAILLAPLQGLREYRIWNLLRMAQPGIWLVLLVTMAATKITNPIALGYVNTATYWVVAPLIFLAVHRVTANRYGLSLDRAKALARFGAPTVLAALPQQANRRFDQLLMAALVAPGILGLYVAAVNVSNLLFVVIIPVAQVLMPYLAQIQNQEEQRATLARVSRMTVLVALLGGIGMMIIGPLAIRCLFGQSFIGSNRPYFVLIVATIFSALSTVLEEALMGLGHPSSAMRAEIVGALLTAVGLLLSLRFYPLMGAAWTSFFSYLVTLLVITTRCRVLTGLSIRDLLIPRWKDAIELIERSRTLARRLAS